jgi:O-antigen/teichoic acid export membrane protein
MSYDFYPKLSAISLDNEKVKQLVNNQIEIALILITPAIIFLYLSAPIVIKLLYSEEFSSSFLILKMALFSVILKAIIFPLGYVVLVKGNKKLFFMQALFSDLLNLVLSIILYYWFGLVGLGMAYVLNYLLYGIYIYSMVKKEYDFHFIQSCKKLITISLITGILAIVIVYSFQQFYVYFLITILFILSLLFSLKGLNQRIKLKEAIMKTINKNKKE